MSRESIKSKRISSKWAIERKSRRKHAHCATRKCFIAAAAALRSGRSKRSHDIGCNAICSIQFAYEFLWMRPKSELNADWPHCVAEPGNIGWRRPLQIAHLNGRVCAIAPRTASTPHTAQQTAKLLFYCENQRANRVPIEIKIARPKKIARENKIMKWP